MVDEEYERRLNLVVLKLQELHNEYSRKDPNWDGTIGPRADNDLHIKMPSAVREVFRRFLDEIEARGMIKITSTNADGLGGYAVKLCPKSESSYS